MPPRSKKPLLPERKLTKPGLGSAKASVLATGLPSQSARAFPLEWQSDAQDRERSGSGELLKCRR